MPIQKASKQASKQASKYEVSRAFLSVPSSSLLLTLWYSCIVVSGHTTATVLCTGLKVKTSVVVVTSCDDGASGDGGGGDGDRKKETGKAEYS
ncbi:hypothetical protein M0804_004509 [Polistes exclamans]|nr:hypothetical protein M0804_004509 [Polistes exclamans]